MLALVLWERSPEDDDDVNYVIGRIVEEDGDVVMEGSGERDAFPLPPELLERIETLHPDQARIFPTAELILRITVEATRARRPGLALH